MLFSYWIWTIVIPENNMFVVIHIFAVSEWKWMLHIQAHVSDLASAIAIPVRDMLSTSYTYIVAAGMPVAGCCGPYYKLTCVNVLLGRVEGIIWLCHLVHCH